MKAQQFDPKRQRRMTCITVVLVILAGIISSWLRQDNDSVNYLTFHNEGYIIITDDSGNSETVHYLDMIAVDYLEAPDYGMPAGGCLLDEEMRLGLWHSESLGTYTNCTDTDITGCIFIRTESGTYAINMESEDTTQKLHSAILDAQRRLTEQEESE